MSGEATPRLKVLHLGKYFPPTRGGMETYLADLLLAQRTSGIDARAIVHAGSHDSTPSWVYKAKTTVTFAYAPLSLEYRKVLKNVLNGFQPDVLHLHLPNVSVFALFSICRSREIPWVIHWQSDIIFSGRPFLTLAYLLFRPLELLLLRSASRIIATSPPYLEYSKPLTSVSSKCGVVPLGIPLPVSANSASISEEGHFKPASLKLLALGRLASYKGLDFLIQVVSQSVGVHLIIAGDGEMKSTLAAQLQSIGNSCMSAVTLLGEVSEQTKGCLLNECDVLCLASDERSEAFGMVILEAMAYEKACLVSELDGSGMGWIVSTTGCGLVCAPRDFEAWSEAIAWLQTHDTQRVAMGKAGRKALLSSFLVERSIPLITYQYALAGVSKAINSDRGLLIVIPAHNEEATIGHLIQALLELGHQNILVVDDASTDKTALIASQAGAMVVQPAIKVGAWGGMHLGLRYAWEMGFTSVVTMDADGQHIPDEVVHLLQFQDSADVVIGAHPQRASKLRVIAWHWFRSISSLKVEDLTSGFRYYSGKAIAVLAQDKAMLLEYQDIGTLLLLHNASLTVKETLVHMLPRTTGHSRIFNSFFDILKYMTTTTLLILSRWK